MNNEVIFAGDEKKGQETKNFLTPLLIEGEEVLIATKGIRDGAAFTNKRVMILNKQGLTGKKVEVFSISLKSITAFAVENAGTFDLDAELKIFGSGYNLVQLQFTRGYSLKPIANFLGKAVL